MTELDLLILTVYVITVTYVLYQMIESLEAKTTIQYLKGEVDRQIADRNLQDILDVKFKFDDRYSFDQPKTLALTLENKSQHSAIYIDWDRCTFSDVGAKSRRVIRITPDKREELFQPQMFSTVAPQNSLSVSVTAEDVLKPDPVSNALAPAEPLINIDSLDKGIKGKFLSNQAPIPFALQLALRIRDLLSETGYEQHHTLTCPFVMNKVPWQDALPFNPK